MTKQEQDIFFSVIRASIWQKEIDVDIPVGFQWKPVLQAYADHAILAVVADKILALPEDRQPTKEQKKLIMWYVASNIKTHNQLNIALVDAFQKLEAAGCHPVLLKGQGLATLYPNPQMRGCGDIDIYVGEEEFEKACSVINEICGVNEDVACHINSEDEDEVVYDENGNFISGLHYHIQHGDVIFEVHRKPADAAISSKEKAFNEWAFLSLRLENCETVSINGHLINVPGKQYNSLFIFDHLAKHYLLEGVGLRQFIDWALVLHHAYNKISIPILQENLLSYSSLRAWQVLGTFVVDNLGLSLYELPCANKLIVSVKQSELLRQNIIEQGNFGLNGDSLAKFKKCQGTIKNDIRLFVELIEQYKMDHVVFSNIAFPLLLHRLHCLLGLMKKRFLKLLCIRS